MKILRPLLGAAVAALCLVAPLHAQLAWSVFNETTSTAAPASSSTNGVVVTVPAGQRVTLYATNFAPIDFSAVTSGEVYVTTTFKASGGLSGITSGTRAVGYGLYNNGGTNPGTTFGDDNGYFTWLNGRQTGSLIELRRRNGDGTSPSLLNPTGTAFNSLGTGTTTLTAGALADSGTYAIQMHLIRTATGVSLGNTSSTTTGAGIWVSGDGLSQTAYTNPDTPPATTVFNEIGFMFLNSSANPVTLEIVSVTGLTPLNPPAITTQPAALIVNPGQAASLSVVATGTAPLTYQWKKDGANVTGATSATLAFASAATADAGSYTVTITNPYGSVTSAAATVTVTTSTVPATITAQPVATTVTAGGNASFTVAAFGSAPLTYQWQKNGANIVGATSATFTITGVTTADAANYTVVVSNSAATVTSSAAALTVNTAPVITTQPVGATVAAGQAVTFTVAATGNPAPSYQWLKNGANIAGATAASYTVSSAGLADTGVYTVRIVNSIGAVTSSPAVLAIPSTMVATAFSPANSAAGINIDTPLRVTFDRAPTVGIAGRIRIFKASDNTVVDTIDLGAAFQLRNVGTNTAQLNYFPVIVTGNAAAIYPHAGVLAYGQTYYVTVEPGALRDATNASFTGISDPAVWRFSTKATGPAANASSVTVAADGSGDFNTVQGAIDFVPVNNTQRVVINLKKGTYTEQVYVGSNRPFITLRGEDRAQSIVTYPNNNNLNGSTRTRGVFTNASADFAIETLTIFNSTPQGGSQAEGFVSDGLRVLINRCNLRSRQDTLLCNTGTVFITDTYIEGNTDFIWGTASAYFERCELKALDTAGQEGYYTQVRNPQNQIGFVFVDCRLTGEPTAANYYLGRIDPTTGNFPFSQAVYINCAMGPHILPVGWQLNNATTSATVQDWEYQSTDLNGAALDLTKRLSSSKQITAAVAAQYRDPAFVLNGWNPQIAPTIEAAPVAQSATVGSNVRLSVVANAAPQATYQWFKDGVAIAGATNSTLLLAGAQVAASGNYTVTVTNASGSITTPAVAVTVARGKFVGTYFGTITGGGTFALYVRDDSSGVFLGTNSGSALFSRAVAVDANGRFQVPVGFGSFVDATINSAGAITGTVSGITLTGARTSTTGTTAAFAGYYPAGTAESSTTTYFIVGGAGQAYVVTQSGAQTSAALGTVDTTGKITATVGTQAVTATIAAGAASVTGTAGSTAFSGTGDIGVSTQRFREISTRSGVAANGGYSTVGFVLTGDSPVDVLVRGIGPALSAFGVGNALAAPKLDLYNGAVRIATNTGWSTALNSADIAAGATIAGAFPLVANSADSAIRVKLNPGAYTAVMSSATASAGGAGLVEIYDITFGSAGQRLVNLSTLALAGSGDNTLIAGVAVSGTAPKRMLVRAVGPSLAQAGVTGFLARPVLSLYSDSRLVAQNAGLANSADALAITTASAQSGAFPLTVGASDSALLVNLVPGLYTAQVTSADGAIGMALIEFYELP